MNNNTITVNNTITEAVDELTAADNWTGVERPATTYDKVYGLRLAVRHLRDDLRSVGFSLVRDTKDFECDGRTVAIRTVYTGTDGHAGVCLTVTGYPAEAWLDLVRLGVRGGFTVEVKGAHRAIVLTMEVQG